MTNDPNSVIEEEILLFSADVPDQVPDESSFQNLSYKFQQIDSENLSSKQFCIYDNQYLSVIEIKGKKKQQYWLNLAYIDNTPVHKFKTKWLYCWLSLAFLSCAAVTGLTPIVNVVPKLTGYGLSITVGFVTLSLLSMIALIRNSKRVVNFYSKNGRVALVELFNKNPDKKSFLQFLKALIERSNLTQSRSYFEPSQQFAAELNEHRRLRDLGILTAEQYNFAKDNIFALHATAN